MTLTASGAAASTLASSGFTGTVQSGPLLVAVGVSVLVGVIGFLSPCVLPLVPGYLSYVAGLAGSEERPSQRRVVAGAVLVPKDLDRSSARAKKIRRTAAVIMGLVLLAFVVGFAAEPFGAPVIIVKITGDGVKKTRGRLFGSQSYTFQNGQSAMLGKSGGTVVVNDSTTLLHVVTQSYGDEGTALLNAIVSSPENAPPMLVAALDHDIQFVGPDDPPPPSVQGAFAQERYWLDW